ncbi:MAG TPA: UvrD-helicase domain-containing protein [Candidatus Hydrogenedentes bacterium]|nr:UvrD-helicase domain-containing protein [Candidatus Hydrogenedentota bacterium]
MKATPAQHRAITRDSKRLCVDASAGSGKTRVLVERILRIIETGAADLDEMVAITFTDNAAAEMKSRLRGAFRLRGDEAASPEEQTRWRRLERRVETARISTFHSFCMSLFKQYALRYGEDPDFAVLTEAEATMLVDEMIESTLHRLLDQDDDAAHRVAVEFGIRTLSQMFRVMLDRRHLLERGDGDWELLDEETLIATRSRVLAEEAARLATVFLTRPEVRRWRCDLASAANGCDDPSEKRERERCEWLAFLAIDPRAASAEQIERELFALMGQRRSGRACGDKWISREKYECAGRAITEIREFAKAFVFEKPEPNVERRAARMTRDLFATFACIAAAYDEAKRQRSVRDFDDLIRAAHRLLSREESIRLEVAQGIRHLLIDEFQDTDSRQLEIAELLANAENGPDLFVVGDAKQSIYLFRGAEVEVFCKAQNAAGTENAIPLDSSFRSAPELLRFVNDFFASTGLLTAVAPTYRPLEAHRPPANECRVEFLLPPADDPARNRSDYRAIEAELIARRIAQMCSGPDRVSIGSGEDSRPAEFGDVALLFRTLNDVHSYERALKDRGIPYALIAGRGYYQRPEIVDLRNFLTLVCDPWNEIALLGYLRGPLVGLSDDSILLLAHGRGLADSFHSDWTPEDFAQRENLDRARSLLQELRLLRDAPLYDFLSEVMHRTHIEAIALGQFLGRRRALNLRKALDLAADFTRSRPARLSLFVRYLDRLSREELREGEAALAAGPEGSVVLTTIHQSKGLEYPIVFVPDISRNRRSEGDGSLDLHPEVGPAVGFLDEEGRSVKPPLSKLIRLDRELRARDEFARLLYVALTRARDWLALSGAPTIAGAPQSWLAAFEREYGVLAANDGEILSPKREGAPIAMRVRRSVPDVRPPAAESQSDCCCDVSAILRRVASITLQPIARSAFSVTEVAREMASEEWMEAPNAPAPDGPRPELSSLFMNARIRGEMIHALLERWDGTLNAEIWIDAVVRRYCPIPSLHDSLKRDMRLLLERMHASPLRQWWSRDSRIVREKSFVLRVDDALLSGTIDAYMPQGPIWDYKTGERTRASSLQYEYQLLLYASAMRALTGRTPTAAYLLYTDASDLHETPLSPARIDNALERARAAMRTLNGVPVFSGERKKEKS